MFRFNLKNKNWIGHSIHATAYEGMECKSGLVYNSTLPDLRRSHTTFSAGGIFVSEFANMFHSGSLMYSLLNLFLSLKL